MDRLRLRGPDSLTFDSTTHAIAARPTLMHLNGVPTVVIAAWLGHQDPGFTLRTYAHSNDTALVDAGAILGAITTGKKKEAK